MHVCTKIKNLFNIVFISLIAFSCATNGPKEEVNPGTILPTIDQETFDKLVFQVQNSGQYRKFVTVDNAQITNPNAKRGFAYYKGLDRMLALRQYLIEKQNASIRNNTIGFIGRQLVSGGIPSGNTALDCTGVSSCTLGYNGTLSVSQNTQTSTAALGLLFNRYDHMSQNNLSPMGFAYNSNVTFYKTENTTGGNVSKFESLAIAKATKHAKDNGAKMLVFDGWEGLRLKGFNSLNYRSNNYLDNTSHISDIRDQNNNIVYDLVQVYNIVISFSDYLASANDNVLVMATGTMAKYNGINSNVVNSTNQNYSDQVAYGYYNVGHRGTTGANGFLPISGQSFLNGNIVQYVEANSGSASKNNIALAVAVNQVAGGSCFGNFCSDYIYRPYAEVVLPGALRNYSFSVMIKPEFGNNGGNGSTLPLSQTGGTKGQLANAILASNINTLGALMDDNTKAISLLKTNFTLTTYGNSGNPNMLGGIGSTTPNNLTSGFVSIEGPANLPALIFGTPLQTDIIQYFDTYAFYNNNTISDSLNGTYFDTINYNPNESDTLKWNKILQLYAGNEYMLSQFITTSDVIVCDGPCNLQGSNIISMNGIHGQKGDFAIVIKDYEYYDVNGNLQTGSTKVYTYKGETIASNVFGNGIVDFTTLYNNATAKTNSVFKYNVFETKMRTSAVMGDGFKRKDVQNFLSKIETDIGSVFEGEGQTIDMSLNGHVNANSSRSREKMNMAFKNLFNPESVNTGGRFNLGSVGVNMNISGNETSSKGLTTKEAEKAKIMQGFVGGATRFGDFFLKDEKPLAFNPLKSPESSENNAKISNIGISAPISENANVALITSGSSIDFLTLEKFNGTNFTVLSKGLGFREGYGSFAELFSESENIQGGAFSFGGDEFKINALAATGERQNILNNKIQQSSFASLEASKTFENTKVKFVSGVLSEEGSLLGTQFSGGFEIVSSLNYFAGFEFEQKLFGNVFLNADYSYGISTVDTGNASIFRNFSNIKTSAMSAGITNKNFFGGSLGFNYSSGLRINSASATLDNGNFLGTFDISSDGKERNFELSFNKTFKETSSIQLSLVHTEDLDNIKGERQNLLVLKAAKKF